MTDAQIDALGRRLRDRIAPWLARLRRLVEGKVEDARAHAERAVTDAAKSARDGRPTLVKLKGSRSYQAAVNRLAELHEALAGRRSLSDDGMLRDMFEASYRDSFAFWAGHIDPSLLKSDDPKPTQAGVAQARVGMANGTDPYGSLVIPIQRAIVDLDAALYLAASRYADERRRLDPLDAWEEAKRHSLSTAVAMAATDGDMRAHTLAALDVLDPKQVDPNARKILGLD